MSSTDSIVAIATPAGKGGVGVLRISGPKALEIGEQICGKSLPARRAMYARFLNADGDAIDSGLGIYFAGPYSFTGEDVVELQGHGGPIILDLLLKRVIALGARQARAGEFSERAFLNNKIDLTQAEAIADLIDSTTEHAAKGAMRSLQGEFSNKVQQLLEELIYLRTYVEAAIDFPDEEIEFLADNKIRQSIEQLQQSLATTIQAAGQGAILRHGLRLVIAGKPNAGKSSLLNALAGQQTAIVTDIAGTTRDIVSETIDLDGLPVHIIDTAGLRESADVVERIGIERARKAIQEADHTLLIIDATDEQDDLRVIEDLQHRPHTLIYNKVDLINVDSVPKNGLAISVKTGQGMYELKQAIKNIAGFVNESETVFTARRRHLTALEEARDAVTRGLEQLTVFNAGELLADELLQAQNHLNSITGEFTADDLLGEIFSGFCIGK